jgi:hypothetical protein
MQARRHSGFQNIFCRDVPDGSLVEILAVGEIHASYCFTL